MATTFEILNSVDVNGKTEKKGNQTYLSWAYAWGEVKKRYPEANYTIYKNADGWNYHTDGRTAWVECSVTINGLEHIEHLAVMDARNQAVKLENVTSTMVGKTIQRCITKACARHGLGLYVYAGEDLPEGTKKDTEKEDETISFGTASEVDTEPSDVRLPFDLEGPVEVEPIEVNALRALMYKDKITDDQLLSAFRGKYTSIDSIEPEVIEKKIIPKWEEFTKAIIGGN